MMNFSCNFTEFRHTGESNLLVRCALWDGVQISPIPTECLPHWGCCCGQQPEFGTSSSSYKECQLFKSVQPAMTGCIDRWFQGDFFFFSQQLGKESIPGFETCLQLGISQRSASRQLCRPCWHTAVMLSAAELCILPLRASGVLSLHGHRGFGHTHTSFRAGLGIMAQHHIVCVCLQSKIHQLAELRGIFMPSQLPAFTSRIFYYFCCCFSGLSLVLQGYLWLHLFPVGEKKVLACILTQGKSKISLSPGFSALQLANSVAFG